MELLQPPKIDELSPCPYLPGRDKQFRYFFAKELAADELAYLLAHGWRKFGPYYFRPNCPACQQCVPLRVLVDEFKPSKSQRKNLRQNEAIEVKFGPLAFSERAYQIYQNHSETRFTRQGSDLDGFLFNFYSPSCPSLQSEFYLDGQLIAIGYLDQGIDCLSSVYFVYDTAYTQMGLGTFSILQEIAYTRQLGLPYYYLGYYVQECRSMAYKNNFRPRQHYDWESQIWRLVED
jgi:arginine-tRNA-protein transferase